MFDRHDEISAKRVSDDAKNKDAAHHIPVVNYFSGDLERASDVTGSRYPQNVRQLRHHDVDHSTSVKPSHKRRRKVSLHRLAELHKRNQKQGAPREKCNTKRNTDRELHTFFSTVIL